MTVVAVLTLPACSGDAETQDATTPTTMDPAVSEVTTTATAPVDDTQTTTAKPDLSAEEQDQADIEETLQAFNAALASAANGDESIEAIYPFSRDMAREQWVTQVLAYEAQGISFSGLPSMEVLEVSVEGNTSEAVVCADVSAVEAVDENGESVVSENRLNRSLQNFILERDDSAELGWFVVEDLNRNEPCDG
ncbi:hypothetical protein [Serinicoccus sp. LYQ131]|uniref:hypothetical protein n=1 Tax=Serinicoccus sp. LYQ131 TaxID=3378797 RepID=UPI003854C42F